MLEFLASYGLFLLKVATIVIAIIVVMSFAAELGKRSQGDTLEVEKLNDKYRELATALRSAVAGKSGARKVKKAAREQKKAEDKAEHGRPRS